MTTHTYLSHLIFSTCILKRRRDAIEIIFDNFSGSARLAGLPPENFILCHRCVFKFYVIKSSQLNWAELFMVFVVIYCSENFRICARHSQGFQSSSRWQRACIRLTLADYAARRDQKKELLNRFDWNIGFENGNAFEVQRVCSFGFFMCFRIPSTVCVSCVSCACALLCFSFERIIRNIT